MLKNIARNFLVVAAVLLVGGCARPIKIVPNVDVIAKEPVTAKIDKRVGYYISPENLTKVVETPAGGGDRVSYSPYADFEPGFKRVLENVFSQVTVVRDLKNPGFQENNISLLFVPTLRTDSSSRNDFFWPPTDFSVALDCIALDNSNKQLWSTSLTANGGVRPVSDILKEFGMMGRLAMENALRQLQAQLQKAEELRR